MSTTTKLVRAMMNLSCE